MARGSGATPRYFCVRLSFNGAWIHQLCDPNDGDGRTTGVVRAATEELWNDLKRAHFIDIATRAVTRGGVTADTTALTGGNESGM